MKLSLIFMDFPKVLTIEAKGHAESILYQIYKKQTLYRIKALSYKDKEPSFYSLYSLCRDFFKRTKILLIHPLNLKKYKKAIFSNRDELNSKLFNNFLILKIFKSYCKNILSFACINQFIKYIKSKIIKNINAIPSKPFKNFLNFNFNSLNENMEKINSYSKDKEEII